MARRLRPGRARSRTSTGASSSTPTLKACVTKTTNALRYTTSTCKSGEKVLTWSIAGVAGPKGATGATGPQGATGVPGPQGPAGSGSGSGPVMIYHSDNTGGFSGSATVSTLRVPVGSYLLDWDLLGTTNGGNLKSCTLTAGGAELPSYATFAAATTISLGCSATNGSIPINFQHAEIIATVATLLPGV